MKLYQYLKTTLRDTSSLTDELSRIGALSSAVQVTKRPDSRGPVLLPKMRPWCMSYYTTWPSKRLSLGLHV